MKPMFYRLWLSMMLVSLSGVLILGGILVWANTHEIWEGLQVRGTIMANTLVAPIGKALLEDDLKALSPIAYNLASQPEVQYVIIRDENGLVINQKGETLRDIPLIKQRVPIKYFHRTLGEIEIAIRTDLLRNRLRARAWILLLVLFFVSGLCAFVAMLASRRINHPVKRLNEAIDAMAKGDKHRLDVASDITELVSLGQAFNQMAETIADREAKLEASRQEAEEANRVKGWFLAIAGHEIRTPLGGIQGIAESLLDTPLSSEQKQDLTLILQCSRSLNTLLNDLLDHAKIEANRLTVESIPFELMGVVTDAIALMRQKALDKDLYLKLEYPDGLPKLLMGDPTRVRQVLLNVIGNAIKFTHSGGVTLSVVQEDDCLRLAIQDTGIGISPEAQPTLFQPFKQAQVSTSREYGGTGLGLSLSKSLVELMGGQIGFTSIPQRGTCFWLTLPVRLPETVEVPEATAILVVEDNPINQKVLAGLLHKFGHQVTIAASGEEALSAVEKQSFGLILMDCLLPDRDGFEVARQMRQSKISVPIVATTALDVELDRVQAAGMNDFLAKPIQRDALVAILQRHLKGAGALSESLPLA